MLKLLPPQTMREPARKFSRPTASWRKRLTGSPVVRLDAPFAAPLAGTTTEPRRSWLPSAAGRKTTVECIKRLQALACSRKASRLDFRRPLASTRLQGKKRAACHATNLRLRGNNGAQTRYIFAPFRGSAHITPFNRPNPSIYCPASLSAASVSRPINRRAMRFTGPRRMKYGTSASSVAVKSSSSG